ncbi:hypothetical protein NL108_011976 [Boleophthalmus pectinirostris]|uniref:proteinase-activated receptor 1-like n=1 Tax=Boleophthalmus pectinirostris TaxID=150288 RepID=UPI000A1C6FC1|nr:proteinase-activated receptor 1-like [Boleophthalmus pectinirostris]KAJ0050109.1 hypothetical protein NL108_011976 [Boleophthalmus pectinirostris]
MKPLNHPLHRSSQVLRCLWSLGCWFKPCPVGEGGVSSSRSWLRGFLFLKVVTLLLFPHWTALGLILGCPFSIKALVLLLSPQISTKPTTVFLFHLALADALLMLHWMLPIGHKIAICFGVDFNNFLTQDLQILWLKNAFTIFSNHLLDAHLLASLFFLGFVGLEATMVSRWPLQTRNIRTSHWAQLGCSLVWVLVLSELVLVIFSTIQNTQTPPSFFSLDTLSFCLRRVLWLYDLWVHYNIIYHKPQKRRSSFH